MRFFALNFNSIHIEILLELVPIWLGLQEMISKRVFSLIFTLFYSCLLDNSIHCPTHLIETIHTLKHLRCPKMCPCHVVWVVLYCREILILMFNVFLSLGLAIFYNCSGIQVYAYLLVYHLIQELIRI